MFTDYYVTSRFLNKIVLRDFKTLQVVLTLLHFTIVWRRFIWPVNLYSIHYLCIASLTAYLT